MDYKIVRCSLFGKGYNYNFVDLMPKKVEEFDCLRNAIYSFDYRLVDPSGIKFWNKGNCKCHQCCKCFCHAYRDASDASVIFELRRRFRRLTVLHYVERVERIWFVYFLSMTVSFSNLCVWCYFSDFNNQTNDKVIIARRT